MFDIEIGGKPVKAKVTFLTAVIYEAEFKSDLVKDYFGKQVFRSAEARKKDNKSKTLTIDFTATNWGVVSKVLWAALKTVDPNVPGYECWARDTEGVNLWFAAEALSIECADCFFRPDSAGAEEEEG